jgi:phosphatidylglycerol---prolipoprotein diacylglyceryl transferase
MIYHPLFAWFYWNPPRDLFVIPFINHPVRIYGFCFVLGFILGYFLVAWMFKQKMLASNKIKAKQLSYQLVDKLTWFVVIGTIVGARLGDVFFYDWPYYRENLLTIFMIWRGGLASHGGVIGVIIAVYLYYRWILKPYPEFTFIGLLDILVVPAGLAAFFIRIGNFFNQEILGPKTDMPWGIVFGDPIDGISGFPRHPTQLYEAISYLLIFFLTIYLYKTRSRNLKPGMLSGLFFIAVFGSRFFIEFIKSPQSMLIDESFLQMGQYLSIPFILFGFTLILFGPKWNGNEPRFPS